MGRRIDEVNEYKRKIAFRVFLFIVLVFTALVAVRYRKAVIVGSSMQPTYYEKDIVWVDTKCKRIHRGDVVVVKVEGEDKLIIKRVIATPKDTIKIKDSKVFVNDRYLKEDYIYPNIKYNGNITIELSDDEYYVLGDNRPVSRDSRVFGPVTKNNILGVVKF